MKLITAVFAVLMLSLPGISACADEKAAVDAKALFEAKCSQCHSIDRPKSKKKTEAEWEKTVMRMKNQNGCDISDEEAKIIIKYLSETYGKEAH
ncbi:MAG: photosystem P840 reaction-center cytochrome c-551 [Nitrospirae bacterium]|nr:photosystem P840 reaction-center cytochrome c-551 [Nitrospirota bacterium]